MKVSDFDVYEIHNFTPKEVRDTGADLRDVKKESMLAIQKFRVYIRRRVRLIKNGMTTGGHVSPYHPRGEAIDGYLDQDDGPVKTHEIIKGAIHSGFKGIGIYYNQTIHSFHFDLRPNYAFWAGVKDTSNGFDDWQWFSLIRDLTSIKL